MEQYFEGEMPSTEELDRLIVEAVAAGHADADRLRLDQDGRRRRRTARRARRSAALPPTAVARTATKDGDDGDAQGRSGRAAGRPGLQDPHRSVRAEAELHPHLLRHAQEGRDRAAPRRAQGDQDRPAAVGAGRQDRANVDEAGAGRHRGRRQDAKTCTPARRWAKSSCRRSSSPRRWSAWPSRPRAAATRPSSPARCTRSPRKTAPSTSTTIAETKEMVLTGMSELHLHADPRAAQAPRQGRGRDQRAEDSLPRDDPDQRRGQLSPQEAVGRLAASSAKSTSACTRSPKARTPRSSPPRSGSRSSRTCTTTRRTTSCGSTRSSAARSPATSCRRSKRAFRSGSQRGVDRRLPGAERLRRGLLRQGPPGRLERNGVPHRRPQGVRQRLQAGQAGPAWSRS